MNEKTIGVLLIEDNPGDARLAQVRLSDAQSHGWGLPRFEVTWVNTLTEALARLNGRGPDTSASIDVVLTDLDLPDSRAGETFITLRHHCPNMPIVVLTGREDPDLARTSVRAGAQDYLFKNDATGALLAHALMYAVERQQNARALQRAHDELEQRVAARTQDLQRVNEALRESERKYRLLIENLNEGIWYIDEEAYTTLVNPRMAELLGYTVEEMLGKHLFEFMDERGIAIAKHYLGRRGQGIREQHTFEFLREDGTRIYTNLAASPIEEQGVYRGAIASVQDITARKLTQEALRERERLFRTLFNNVKDGIFVHPILPDNQPGSFIQVNDAACDMLGYSREELSKMTPWELDDSDSSSDYIPEAMQQLQEKGSAVFEATQVAKGGRKVLIEVSANICELRGAPHIISVVRDITERKRAERELRRYATALEHSNEALQQFAYSVSHDLKAPLRMVKSFLKLLHRHYAETLDKDAQAYIQFAVDGATQMDQLIHALLEYARVESQGRVPVLTDAGQALEDVLGTLQFSIEEVDAEVTYDPLPTVLADATQLRQLFQNLIGNALKFCAQQQKPRVHVGVARHEDEWVFSVVDNGVGIAKKDQARIFEVFQRLHTQEEYEGTGIGLAVCKKIVERHGGRIWVESRVGEGSTFYFTLPVA